MNFAIRPTLAVDTNEGCVWVSHYGGKSRQAVRLTALETGDVTYAELRLIDKNFVDYYNDEAYSQIDLATPTMVVGQWYRNKLGFLKIGSTAEIEIAEMWEPLAAYMACKHHPQTVVRVSTWLGVIGVALGVIALIPLVRDIFHGH